MKGAGGKGRPRCRAGEKGSDSWVKEVSSRRKSVRAIGRRFMALDKRSLSRAGRKVGNITGEGSEAGPSAEAITAKRNVTS